MTEERPLSGVGGWLKLLVFCLMWLGPLFTVALTGLAVFVQLTAGGSGSKVIFVLGDIFFLFTGYLSFKAGKGLKEIRPGAAASAKLYFLTVMAGCALVGVYVGKLIFFSEISKLAGIELIRLAVYPVLYAVCWYGYLSDSVRVRNTYH